MKTTNKLRDQTYNLANSKLMSARPQISCVHKENKTIFPVLQFRTSKEVFELVKYQIIMFWTVHNQFSTKKKKTVWFIHEKFMPCCSCSVQFAYEQFGWGFAMNLKFSVWPNCKTEPKN